MNKKLKVAIDNMEIIEPSTTKKAKLSRSLIRATAITMTLITIVIMVSSTASAAFQANMITAVSNPSNRKIKVTVSVPAKSTVTYGVRVKANTGYYYDVKSTRYTNNTTKAVSASYTFTVSLYGIYEAYASRQLYSYYYKDAKSVRSNLIGTVYSSKFTWTDAKIKQHNRGERIGIVLTFGTGVALDLLVTKGLITASIVAGFSAATFSSDLKNSGSAADTKTINLTPIRGWGYKIKLVPLTGNKIRQYLVVYDGSGKLYKEYLQQTYTYNAYCRAV